MTWKALCRPLAALVLAGFLGGGLGACAPIENNRGQLPEKKVLARIHPGQQTKDDVQRLLGSPSSVATFDKNTWYYINRQTQTVAFYAPDVIDQQVVQITFDDSNVVREIKHYGLEDAESVSPIARTTETRGRKLSFFEQALGNLGRFGGAQ